MVTQKTMSVIPWTESKTALIELVYALHFSGAIANGDMEIKEIVLLLEKIFSIELGDFYRTFTDIKMRANPTKFIDQLKNALHEKLNIDIV